MQHIRNQVHHLVNRLLSRLRMSIGAIKSEICWGYSWIRTLKFFRQPRWSMLVYNTYFDSAELHKLSYEIGEMGHTDRYLQLLDLPTEINILRVRNGFVSSVVASILTHYPTLEIRNQVFCLLRHFWCSRMFKKQ